MTARAEDWPHLPLAQPYEEIAFPRELTAPERERLALGHVPRSKTEKWFIFQDGKLLNFHRAASGECVFQLDADAGLCRVAGLEGFSAEDRRAVLEHLIDRVLLGRDSRPPAVKAFARLDGERLTAAWKNLIG